MASPTVPATGAAEHELPQTLIDRLASHIASYGAETATIAGPFTGEPLATVPVSGADDVRKAYERAREAQLAWAARPAGERVKPFLRLPDALVDRREEILDIIQLETGKARRHAMEEFLDVALCSLYYARRAPKLLKPRRRQGMMPGATRVQELRHPKGVVALITPWNYPFSLGASDIAPALMAGNAVIHKPDTQTCLSSLWVLDLLISLGLPRDLWQIVVGDPGEIGDPLVDEADYVSFTGSTRGGRAIAEKVAPRLVGYSLELGGKNPMIVMADADVERTARGAVRACFTNAGQLCISIERMYVHEDIYDRFVPRFAEMVTGMKLGTGLDFDVEMGSLTFQRQLDAVTRHVDQAVEEGATVLAGGKARPDIGPLFYEPTILTDVTGDMDLCANETFGPVVAVYKYRDEDEVVARANDTPYGLNASVWTKNAAKGRRLASRIHAGTVNVNDGYGAAFASYDSPMGGMKQSGVGRRHGSEGLLRFTEVQTVASQHFMDLEPPGSIGYAKYADLMSSGIKLMKKLRIK
ncbi:succinic semialdehyde dehydrogenase [Actinomadura madurae]|uniref:succinic semialdehyde dehydrogenase n=1 Tax=Actinomadura madurae TaxID=1993 RepID=UPI0020D22435|nr:succinic semialdehyde dehydrogenase [Actinomadura madurae]MCP9953084.1 succinic semialdehyde dehydrogenase [Actinomadura madurae]MCP9969850.1 succinic semialdehyde dehydrogenase [Actinomadura madurae]MCP9982304.1 succinic semialdehyde dehydrogenase [Actinomadura madurae]MCQ0006168.1 succinic semialdehyde dehydrogenase [Actinomadura madurae]MCQ0018548.1 succinic semialdehyde dehydrogenase [Actinomadura madurae]